MVMSLALPRTRLAVWVQSRILHSRQPQGSVSMSPLVAPMQRPPDEHSRRVVPPANPYALEFEEGEPTWEDAEWQ